jgi:hypothetical protein
MVAHGNNFNMWKLHKPPLNDVPRYKEVLVASAPGDETGF